MTSFGKLILILICVPLLAVLFLLLLPLILFLVFLGLFFPVLRMHIHSFGSKASPRWGQKETGSGQDICDIEGTVLHSETIEEEEIHDRTEKDPGKQKLLDQ